MTTAAPGRQEPRSPYHVLLIGIEAYASGSPLGGCVNDIDAIQRLFLERLAVPRCRIRRFAAPIDPQIPRPTEIETENPTRAALIEALRALARDGEHGVKAGDRVFIYYSGHGAQRFVKSAADGARSWREALVPADNLTPDYKEQLIFDWELRALLDAITEKTPSVTVVLDCCNSAGATRALSIPREGARFLPPPPGSTVMAAPDEVAPLDAGIERGLAAAGVECMVVAACLDSELAIESGDQADRHGELTRALLERLKAPDLADADLAELRWGRIWPSVKARVEEASPNQHPWLSSSPARRVFGGAPEDGDVGIPVTYDEPSRTYRLGAGELMDVTVNAEVALYEPIGAGGPARFAKAQAKALVRVTAAEKATAVARLIGSPGPDVPPVARGHLVQYGDAARVVVALRPDDQALAARLATSKLVRLAGPNDKARVTLVQRADEDWALVDAVYGPGEAPGNPALPFLPAASAEALVLPWVEHYCRWSAPIRLAERCAEAASRLTIKLLDAAGLASLTKEQAVDPPAPELHPEHRPAYRLKAGTYEPSTRKRLARGERFFVRLENAGPDDLTVTLFYCERSGQVTIHGNRLFVARKSRATTYLRGDPLVPFEPFLPSSMRLGIDYLVAVGTTNAGATLDSLEVEESFADALAGPKRDLPPSRPRMAAEIWTSDVAVLQLEA